MKRIFFYISILIGLISLTKSNTYDVNFEETFKVQHLKVGDDNNYPYVGSKASVHYTGTFPNNGKKFDSSLDRGEKFTFTVGAGEVIKCWDEVVKRMTIGEKIKVVCPWRLAYGENGIKGVIPPRSDLAFEIELFSFN